MTVKLTEQVREVLRSRMMSLNRKNMVKVISEYGVVAKSHYCVRKHGRELYRRWYEPQRRRHLLQCIRIKAYIMISIKMFF